MNTREEKKETIKYYLQAESAVESFDNQSGNGESTACWLSRLCVHEEALLPDKHDLH